MNDRKLRTVQNWAHLRSVKEVKIFIGFANLYRRFIKDFFKVGKPITMTLKENPQEFHWGREQEEMLEELQRMFKTVPILSHFYPGRQTVVVTDDINCALRCILSQYQRRRLHLVGFRSRKLNPAERNSEIHDRELLATMGALREWRRYLLGGNVDVRYSDR